MASCNIFPVSTNPPLRVELAQTLFSAFHLNVTSASLTESSFLSSLFCSTDTAQTCYGICPNADLAGVGVRIAFWLSSILQAILVFKSPEDSSQGAWTAAILTASVTIPAFVQKRQRQLSIYHATLVLNFATFSSIVSLAVAPMCTIWRERPVEDYTILLPDDIQITVYDEGEEIQVDQPNQSFNVPQRKVHRQRLVLSLALVTQIALQWTWAVMLFTDPEYAQKACNPYTIVMLFGKPFTTHSVNHGYFAVWPCWLLFNLSITLIWGILLVSSSSPAVHPVLSRQPSHLSHEADSVASTSWRRYLPVDRGRRLVVAENVLAFLISTFFLVSSEVQVGKNKSCLLGGENTEWSFGQVAALLVS
ncbi:hypothetical protein HYPSUDRAFT_73135 [Hypholoma sublateritium FD-334 SS-4]|uniref:Uncharacterized protein n=1 Tax=Hypholoma sublateritium (strain FD-334 SS-4) TaxID=945553 RepID=A0A0D2NXD4_HYPSF|nr:hypothetical protein HYPSUDRAFT_73135 [Hypholoma sublateritium FD-334 SS-4]